MAKYELNAVVTQRIDVSPELMILRITPDGWELPEFVPGQFAVLGLPASVPRYELADSDERIIEGEKLLRRSYSIASSSKAREYVEFYVNLVRSGEVSPRLFNLKVGDRVWLSRKFSGMFRITDAPENVDLVFVATGTGLAPYMSMLRTDLASRPERKICLLHGARHTWDLGYRSELITYEKLFDNFTYIPTISRPEEEPVAWKGQSGYVQDLWVRGFVEKAWRRKPRPEDTHIFLCGNPDMAEEMLRILASDGFKEHKPKEPGQVHLERFW